MLITSCGLCAVLLGYGADRPRAFSVTRSLLNLGILHSWSLHSGSVISTQAVPTWFIQRLVNDLRHEYQIFPPKK